MLHPNYRPFKVQVWVGWTYEWKTTINAPTDLWFVDVDEDPWMPERTSTTIARDHPLMGPSNRLFVYQWHRGLWLWLLSTGH